METISLNEPLCQRCLLSWGSIPCTVSCIGGCQSDNVEIYLSKSKDKIWVDLEELNPILITEEFLETHGFKKEKEPILKWDQWVSEDRQVIISKLSNTVGRDWSVHVDNEVYETIGAFDVQYAHQLQIALWFCGRRDHYWVE